MPRFFWECRRAFTAATIAAAWAPRAVAAVVAVVVATAAARETAAKETLGDLQIQINFQFYGGNLEWSKSTISWRWNLGSSAPPLPRPPRRDSGLPERRGLAPSSMWAHGLSC